MSSSTQQPVQTLPTLPAQPFRPDVPLHDLLQKPPDHPSLARAECETQPSLTLPSPVFPQHPALLHELDAADIAAHEAVLRTGKRHWPASKVMKTMRGWMFPYFKSRVLPGDFQPIIAYLFTEWKCNLLKLAIFCSRIPLSAQRLAVILPHFVWQAGCSTSRRVHCRRNISAGCLRGLLLVT